MNKRLFNIFYIGLLLLCLFAMPSYFHQKQAWAQGQDKSLFGSYSHSVPFDAVVQNHLHPSGKLASELIDGTWFLGGKPNIAMECRVNADGKGYTVRDVYNWAAQNYMPLQLDAKQLKTLQTLLRSLPSSSVRPPLDRLLILSYKKGNIWVTRLYDKEHLPIQVQKVYRIVGASIS